MDDEKTPVKKRESGETRTLTEVEQGVPHELVATGRRWGQGGREKSGPSVRMTPWVQEQVGKKKCQRARRLRKEAGLVEGNGGGSLSVGGGGVDCEGSGQDGSLV